MVPIKRILQIYDCGSVKENQEDCSFSGHPSSPFFMVYDGASARGPKGEKDIFLATGNTVACEVGRIVKATFAQASNEDDLRKVILRANQQAKIFQEQYRYSLEDAGLSSGGPLAAIKLGKESLSIAQTGDCFVFVVRRDGTAWITDNQMYFAAVEDTETIAKLMQEFGGDREKMWEAFSPILRESRKRDINQPRTNSTSTAYGSLNGQEGFEQLLNSFEEIPLEQIRSVLLFTDGATNLADTKDASMHARLVAERYQRGKLQGIVKAAHENHPKDSYVDADEATCIAIEFS